MKQDSTIAVAQARNLEPGDLFAHETLGSLCSGLVKSVTYSVYQLDEVTRSYMESKHNLEIPKDQYAPLGGVNQYFVLYRPMHWFGGSKHDDYEHIYISGDDMVAVFAYDPRYNSGASVDTPECTE